MDITVNASRVIDENIQIVYFTLTDDANNIYKFHANTPILDGENLQNYLNDHKEEYMYYILYKQYPKADCSAFTESNSALNKIQLWIANGCINPDATVIERVDFIDTHSGTSIPSEILDRGKISISSANALKNATTVEELKNAVVKILLGNAGL